MLEPNAPIQTDIQGLQPKIDAIKAEQRLLQEERARARVAALFTRWAPDFFFEKNECLHVRFEFFK
jgi:hypothetical protein